MGVRCRALTEEEFQVCMASFGGKYENRDRALFLLMGMTGWRVSEVLSLTLGDVVKDGAVVDRVTVQKRNCKGKRRGKDKVLRPEVRSALAAWIKELHAAGYMTKDAYLFQSRVGSNKPISRMQVHRVLKEAYEANELIGNVACHSLRKYFGERVYRASGHDLVATQMLLDHSSVESTRRYLDVGKEELDELVLNC